VIDSAAADLIAVDWGTSRFRAYLLAASRVLDTAESGQGVAGLARDAFPEVLSERCGPWLARGAPPIAMAGMVGSRNGWLEAPYVEAPCGPAALAAALVRVPDVPTWIVPGVIQRGPAGSVDVMRGEETLALGAGAADGLLCLPGTHSKWVVMAGGGIVAFATFVTGELYGVLRDQAFIARLAADEEASSGFAQGLDAAPGCGGLLHGLFAARSRVLGGTLAPAEVRPFLSGLLIATEIRDALARFPGADTVHLVADPPLAELYRAALARHGVAVVVIATGPAFVAGIRRLWEAR
jgi:2-dehydro-3-deoxygalactonokinase